ncbi:histidine kinase [Micromonospora acroterricola]|uniref:Histidine kinase n=1 Tax=Micromonospora acroterricola TaxID=2202421 RepID=A0A317CSZ3_9ACTN|nr:GAF and ANTAR domain-containing protein [Micromonospora acroterricola]PWR05589.1 histidine kinase [Micromonospora acroterricola]
MTETQLITSAEAFARLGRLRFSDIDFHGVLTLVSELAQRTIPGASEVSVTLIGPGGAHTAVSTGDLPLTLDERQYACGQGPCITAATSTVTIIVPEMAGERRWPDWASDALDGGALSSLSIGLPLHEAVTGALNIYATEPDAFDDAAVSLSQSFADHAAAAMANAHLYDTQVTLTQHMQAAMQSRAVIEQAKGIIMAERRCTADQAFAILTRLSQNTNTKVRDVAAALVAGVTSSQPTR